MRRRVEVALAGLWLGVACAGDDRDVADRQPVVRAQSEGSTVPESLLARARASVKDGTVADELAEAILASDAPEHARARRLLGATAEPAPDDPEGDADPDESAAPELRAPPLSAAPVDPEPEPEPRAEPQPISAPAPDKAVVAGPTVSSVGLAKSKGGATLTIRGSGKLIVGTANQLAAGVVHLVIDKASASAAVAAARPKIDGVEVTRVRKGQGTVQISLELAPGWSLGSIRSFSGGTKVNFIHSS